MKLWLAALLAGLVSGAVLFPVGARVTVVNGCANIRATSQGNSTVLGQQCTGAFGTVVASEVRSTASDTLSRANIKFDAGVSGWTWVYYLKLVTPPVPGDTTGVTLVPSTIDFGSQLVGTVSAAKATLLSNTRTDTLRFPGGSSMLDTINFRYVADDCFPLVAPGRSCTFQYVFQPKSAATFVGDNKIVTNHGTARVLLTGVGTIGTPPPPVAGSVNYIAVQPTGLGAPAGGPFYYLSALPYDSGGHVLAAPLTWSVADTTVAQLVPFGVLGTQVVQVMLRAPGTTTVSASAGGHVGNITLSVGPAVPLPTPPPLAAPIFGIRASWVNLLAPIGCPATPGSTCTRGPLPVFSDSGVVQAQMTVTATFAPP